MLVERGFAVEAYDDAASGVLARGEDGRMAFAAVSLRPIVRFTSVTVPSADDFAALHHEAHEACFLANSVRCPVHCEPTLRVV